MPSKPEAGVTESKQSLRARMKALRQTLDPTLGHALATHLLAANILPERAIIAGYIPLPGEIDILPLLHALHGRGHQLCLPETPPKGHPLIFRAWAPHVPLTTGRFGTQHPLTAPLTPTIILTPLVAFDDQGNRLGFGAGYYDRTFAQHPHALRIGIAYAAQQVPHIPPDEHDLPLHVIATEQKTRSF
ncbi:5-formyltetrahydrofolate cyclo-ligase [Acidocella sp.]|uniref:5-formyltetrahydrofolate cyclo-ligase n=1 Tax=Acidocella sp. TaxID=50710 RepID=UPI002604BA12|nr:5-formyltetrahydrofolate cyclo-ligase [Acidocella sp.]